MIIVKLLIFWLIMLGFSYLIGDFDVDGVNNMDSDNVD